MSLIHENVYEQKEVRFQTITTPVSAKPNPLKSSFKSPQKNRASQVSSQAFRKKESSPFSQSGADCQDYSKILPKEDFYIKGGSIEEVIPVCFKPRLEDVHAIMAHDKTQENLDSHISSNRIFKELQNLNLAEVKNGIRIFKVSEQEQKRRYFLNYSLKVNTDFILENIKNRVDQFNLWSFNMKCHLLNQLDENTDIVSLEVVNWLFGFIGVKQKLRVIRNFFFEDQSNYNVSVMMLDNNGSKEFKSVFLCLGFKQIFEKTDIKFFIEVETQKGRFFGNLGEQVCLEFCKSICNYKTFIKQEFYLKTSDFIFIPFMMDETPKSSRRGRGQRTPTPNKNKGQDFQQSFHFQKGSSQNPQIVEEDVDEQKEREEHKMVVEEFQREYQRENLEEVSPEECRDEEGNWTKWVLERCSESQKDMYYQLSDRLQEEANINYLSENTIIRYLKSYNWSIQEAYDRLVQSEHWRRDNNCMKILVEEIQPELNQKMLFIYGNDRIGRPVVYVKMGRFIPANTTFEKFSRYTSYSLDRACAKMSKNVDQYIMVLDCYDMGYKNFDLTLTKQINPIVGNNYADRMYAQYIIRTSFVVNMLFSAIKPFIHEATLKKFHFVGNNYKQELEKIIDLNLIPQEYGGYGALLDDVLPS